jgi:hypothetical protein
MKINQILLISFIFLYGFPTYALSGWKITITNKTNATLRGNGDEGKSDVAVNTTLAGCQNIWLGKDLAPGQSYDERKSGICLIACFDKFRVKDQDFYIPNHCGNSTIEVRPDGVYLNGSKAKPYNCYGVPAWGAELAAKKIAMETALLSLTAAEQFLAKVGKPVATTGAGAVRDAGTGILTGAKETTNAVLSGSEDVAEFLLTAIDIQKRHWDGKLEDLAKGNLGNVEVAGKIFNQSFDISLNLDVVNAANSIKGIAQKIVDLLTDAVNKMNK